MHQWRRILSWWKTSFLAQQETRLHFTKHAEAEYVAEINNCNQVIWMKQMMKDIGITFTEPVVIYYVNKSTVNMSKNPILHSKTKHIAIKCHVLKEKVAEKEMKLEYINTKEWIVDIFTKALPKDTIEYLRGMLGLMPLPSSE